MTTPQQALQAALDWFEAKENCRDHQEVERMIREAIQPPKCRLCGYEAINRNFIAEDGRCLACQIEERTESDGRQLPSPSPVFDVAANEGVR